MNIHPLYQIKTPQEEKPGMYMRKHNIVTMARERTALIEIIIFNCLSMFIFIGTITCVYIAGRV